MKEPYTPADAGFVMGLAANGITLRALDGGKIGAAPQGAMTPDQIAYVKDRRKHILAYLEDRDKADRVFPIEDYDPEELEALVNWWKATRDSIPGGRIRFGSIVDDCDVGRFHTWLMGRLDHMGNPGDTLRVLRKCKAAVERMQEGG